MYIWYHHKYTYTYTKTKKIPKGTRINNIKNKQITNYISLTAESDYLPNSQFPASVAVDIRYWKWYYDIDIGITIETPLNVFMKMPSPRYETINLIYIMITNDDQF